MITALLTSPVIVIAFVVLVVALHPSEAPSRRLVMILRAARRRTKP